MTTFEFSINKSDDAKLLATPTVDLQTQLKDAQKADAYFGAVLKKTAKDEYDINDVGVKKASNVEGIEEEDAYLSDGTAVDKIFQNLSATEKIKLRKEASKAVHAASLALNNKDEVKQSIAEAHIRERGLEEKFIAAQKLLAVNASTFLSGLPGDQADMGPSTLYDYLKTDPNYQAMIDKGQWAGEESGRNIDLRFENADPSAILLRSNKNYMIHDRNAWAPEVTRTGEVIMDPVRRIQVSHLFPQIPTMQEAVRFEQETITTDNVKGFAQNAALQESQLTVVDKTVPIVNFGHYMSTQDIAVQDEPRIQWLVNYRLPEMVLRALDLALIEGTGLNGTITGLGATTGTQSRAKPNGSDETIIDALLKGKTRARVQGGKDIGMPNAYILHVEDIERICLTKTTEGMYIYGNPVGPQPMTVWGLPVAEYNGGSVGTGWVGDFMMYSALYMRRGLSVNFGMINDDFIKLKQAIRAYMRCQLVVTRPAAFLKMTNLDG